MILLFIGLISKCIKYIFDVNQESNALDSKKCLLGVTTFE